MRYLRAWKCIVSDQKRALEMNFHPALALQTREWNRKEWKLPMEDMMKR
jgi:hypothetical protein